MPKECCTSQLIFIFEDDTISKSNKVFLLVFPVLDKFSPLMGQAIT